MVLVIDSADRIAKDDPVFLGKLQDVAKDCADDGNLSIVIILNDSSALPVMMARSSWSRAKKPHFEIGEIPDDQAVEYLTKKGIPEDIAKRAVTNLTGGLLISLNDFVTACLEGSTYEQLMEQRDRALRQTLLIRKVPFNHVLFQRLVNKHSVGSAEALDLGMEIDQLDCLLKDNILAAHPNKTYTFHDRHTAMWFSREMKKSAWWFVW